MSIKTLIDMNLSPEWVLILAAHGWSTLHWISVGNPRASDRSIMDWAIAHGHVLFTHDLDFGTMLALTHAAGPSVVQVRADDVLPIHLQRIVIAALTQHDADLAAGALIVVDEIKCRVRILPI